MGSSGDNLEPRPIFLTYHGEEGTLDFLGSGEFRGGKNEVGTINRRFSGVTRGGEGQVRDKRTRDMVHTARNRHGNSNERICR